MVNYEGTPDELEAVADLVVRALHAKHDAVYSMAVTDGKDTGYSLCTVREGKANWFSMQANVKESMDMTLVHAVRLCSLETFIRVNGLMEETEQ